MSEAVLLISNINISVEDFVAFLEEKAVVTNASKGNGTFSKGESHVWLYMNNQELKSYKPDEIKMVTEKLEGYPQIAIEIQISTITMQQSEQLAIEFSCRLCSKRWFRKRNDWTIFCNIA